MQSINIAIFHHHLNRGGVSSVILNQLSALNNRAHDINIKVAIFYGGRTSLRKELLEPFQDLNLELVELPGLEYDSLRNDFSADHQLADVIEKELARRDFDKSNSVLHFHNHSLGKSRAIVPAINQLAKSGHRIFLQIHDMAEDFRADNYHRLKSELPHLGNSIEDVLPTASQIRYGVINRRDEEILERTGIPSPSICYLPNSVSANEALTDQETAKRAFAKRNQIDADVPLLLYPVRGIRRKNIGEAILLTLVSREPICVGVTLSPINPIENESYQGWKELSADLRLPVLLELGEQDGVTFLDNVAAADAILTTSVAEGFGLVFLESFVFGKPLIGRDIPLITSDFKQSGVKFERLYSELQIPIALINLTDFDHQLRSALGSTYSAFGRELESNEYENHLSQILQTGSIDFARLTVVQQRAVITSAARDPRVRKMLQDANPAIADWISCGPSKNDSSQRTTIEQSKAIIEAKYSDLGTGNKLFSIYTEMLADDPSEVQSNLNPDAVLDYFLSIGNFHPVRVESQNTGVEKLAEEEQFHSIIKKSLSEISPIPTGVTPKLFPLPEIKAVIFDIYGTLLVSSSGDVGTDPAFSDQRKNSDPKLDQILGDCGTNVSDASQLIKLKIKAEHQELRAAGMPFPEIDICSIWESVLTELSRSRGKTAKSDPLIGFPSVTLKEIALRTELLTNPVWKMPGFDTCLREIRNRKIPLGIISNAQFYTATIMEALAEKSLGELGFCNRLGHFSYRIGRAKPDQFLYDLAAKSLQHYSISPEQVLYVGNDVTKDMIPAKEVGFRTGLFAGDKRSLRCGDHGDPQHHHSIDLIFTQLEQITTVLR